MNCQSHHLRTCRLKTIVRDLRINSEPDHEAEHEEDFRKTMDSFYNDGDHFGDYDGPLVVSMSVHSVCY